MNKTNVFIKLCTWLEMSNGTLKIHPHDDPLSATPIDTILSRFAYQGLAFFTEYKRAYPNLDQLFECMMSKLKAEDTKQVAVSFYGLGIKPEACVANVTPSFMMAAPQNPALDLRHRDPDFGAHSFQLRTLGHVGELTLPVDTSAEDLLAFYQDLPEEPQPLTKKQRIQKEPAFLSNPDTMSVRNSKDYWHWFEAQKYFAGKLPDADMPSLLKNDNDHVFQSDPKHEYIEDLVALDDKDFYDARMSSKSAETDGITEPPPMPKSNTMNNPAVRRSEDRMSMANVLYQRLLSAIIPAQSEKIDLSSEQSISSVSTTNIVDKATSSSSSSQVGSKRGRGEKEKRDKEEKDNSATNTQQQHDRSAWVEMEPASTNDLLDISKLPIDRRIAFELGYVGLLREGDLGGNWMKFLEKMITNREDAYVFERWRELREESRLLRGTINASLARVRGMHQTDDDRSLGEIEHEKSTLNKYAKYLKKISDKKAGISVAPKSKKRN
jgi:hypothetical protein